MDDFPGHRCPACGFTVERPSGLFKAVAYVEDAALTVILSAMVLLVLVQIVLRDVFSTGIAGGSETVRHMVLWTAFIAAGLAGREGKHIRIDIAHRVLPERARPILEIVTSLFTMGVCGVLLYASVGFIGVDYETGSTIAVLRFSIPTWALETVIPLGYGMILARYAIRCAFNVRTLFGGGER